MTTPPATGEIRSGSTSESLVATSPSARNPNETDIKMNSGPESCSKSVAARTQTPRAQVPAAVAHPMAWWVTFDFTGSYSV